MFGRINLTKYGGLGGPFGESTFKMAPESKTFEQLNTDSETYNVVFGRQLI